jgi:hypothetical protein
LLLVLKVDRLYGWKSAADTPIRDAFKRQKDHVMKEFDDRSSQVTGAQGGGLLQGGLHCTVCEVLDCQSCFAQHAVQGPALSRFIWHAC